MQTSGKVIIASTIMKLEEETAALAITRSTNTTKRIRKIAKQLKYKIIKFSPGFFSYF
jgi:hypothetical protein